MHYDNVLLEFTFQWNPQFPLAYYFERIHKEIVLGRYVVYSYNSASDELEEISEVFNRQSMTVVDVKSK